MEDNLETLEVAHHIVAIGKDGPLQIKFGSLGAGPCNQGVCCIIDGVPTEYQNLAEHGHMSKDKLSADFGNKHAVEKGVTWIIIRVSMRIRFPKLARFIQRALKVKNHVAKGDHS